MPASNDFNVWATLKRVYGLWFRKDGYNLKLTPSGSTLTADRTINLPNANSDTTLMTIDGTQDVSNKIFIDSVNIQDPGVGTNTISLVAPTLVSSYTLTLPTTDGGANQYLQTDGSGGLSWVTPPGSGDVTGPSSSVDNAIVRFNGTGGKTVQDYTSGAPTISDAGDAIFYGSFVINESAADKDVRVEGTTDQNLLFCDASANKVGIGTSTPVEKLTVLLADGPGDNIYAAFIKNAESTAGRSYGLLVSGGTNNSDIALAINNYTDTRLAAVSGAGEVGIGVAPETNVKLLSKAGATNNASYLPLKLTDSSNAELHSVDSRGFVYYGKSGSWSTGGTAVGISGGFLTTSPSSLRYKTDVRPMTIPTSEIYNLRPVEFTYKNDGRRSFGYIAEEVVQCLPCIVNMEDHGNGLIPESVSYDHLTVLLVEEVKKLKQEIEALKKGSL